MSTTASSSMSATKSWLPEARSPLGALKPSTHTSLVSLPSASSRLIQPLPSLSFGAPATLETNQLCEAACQKALSGASNPSSVATTVRAMRVGRNMKGPP
jgi:hypothetical protein